MADIIKVFIDDTSDKINVSVSNNTENINIVINDVVAGTGSSAVTRVEYEGLGTEGQSVVITGLIGKAVLWLNKGDKVLTSTTGTPTVNQYKLNVSTGLTEFGNDIEQDQIIQVLCTNI